MARVVLGMTMSLDGFINDRTGAVVMGRRAYGMADDPDSYAGNYEFQVPIFVLTHEIPKRLPKQTDKLTFTFVTDGIESAIRQARAAAGWLTNYTSTSCPCFFAAVSGYLKILALRSSNWSDRRWWNSRRVERISDSALPSKLHPLTS